VEDWGSPPLDNSYSALGLKSNNPLSKKAFLDFTPGFLLYTSIASQFSFIAITTDLARFIYHDMFGISPSTFNWMLVRARMMIVFFIIVFQPPKSMASS
jgi:hypothetical protein